MHIQSLLWEQYGTYSQQRCITILTKQGTQLCQSVHVPAKAHAATCIRTLQSNVMHKVVKQLSDAQHASTHLNV